MRKLLLSVILTTCVLSYVFRDQPKLQKVIINETTVAEIVELFGKPTTVSLTNNTTIYAYSGSYGDNGKDSTLTFTFIQDTVRNNSVTNTKF